MRIAAVSALLVSQCYADTTSWTGAVLGDWFTPGNWSNGIPSSTSSALIGPGVVVISANATDALAQEVILSGTSVSPATLSVTDNTLQTWAGVIGQGAGAAGFLSIGEGGTFGAATATSLSVGESGTGTIAVTAGGFLNSGTTVEIGKMAGSNGTVDINGGSWQALRALPGTFKIGDAGTGSVLVSNGGFARLNWNIRLGENGGHGLLRISGSTVDEVTSLWVGTESSVEVRNGGHIEIYGSVYSYGTLEFLSGGWIQSDSPVYLGGDSELVFTLSGAGAGGTGKLYTSGLFLAGDLTLLLDAGFSPALGDEFSLFSSTGGINGQFSLLNLPTLGAGLQWDTNSLYVDGSITIVPEPANSFLFAGGVAALFFRGRRRKAHRPHRP